MSPSYPQQARTADDPEAEIVETTFRSRFRFRFLKYPLSKKVVSFRLPEI